MQTNHKDKIESALLFSKGKPLVAAEMINLEVNDIRKEFIKDISELINIILMISLIHPRLRPYLFPLLSDSLSGASYFRAATNMLSKTLQGGGAAAGSSVPSHRTAAGPAGTPTAGIVGVPIPMARQAAGLPAGTAFTTLSQVS